MLKICAFLMICLSQCSHGLSFEGFYTTNYNETITICGYDTSRGVVLGRTHWPNTPFNEDSAALSGVVVNSQWLYGTGASIQGGSYTFSMHHTGSPPSNAIGTFSFLSKEENGSWNWTYVRPPLAAECDIVTSVWE